MRVHRSRVLLITLSVVAVIAGGAMLWLARRDPGSPSSSSAPARDIILITIDTARADAFGFAGNPRAKTPFLDALAARGLVFTNAHAHNVVTLPSHANILTGLYPFQHGVRENAGFTLGASHPTIATLLRPAGYATGAFVGAFPLDARFGLKEGFDVYDDNYGKGQASVDFVVQERPAASVLAAASEWWSARAGGKRFMWVHLYDPHAPYAPPEPFLSEFRNAPYLGEVSYVDHELSNALTPILAASPGALVIVTSDHGESLGEHGELTHGLFAYEATLKVPLIVAGDGMSGRRIASSVGHVDIVPTILESAGVPVPASLPGASLLRDRPDADSYFESLSASLNRGWAPLTGVIHGGVKYIDLPLAELYDLGSDPEEKTNLLDSRRRDVDAARKILASMAASTETASRNVSADDVARLRSLGYIASTGEARDHYTADDDPKKLVELDRKMHDAVGAFQRGDSQNALLLVREVVAARPSMSAGREMLAFMLQQNDRLAEAVQQLEVIVGQPHANDQNRVQLALLYCATAQPGKAIALLAPRANSSDPDLLNAYGVALSDDGQAGPAQQQFARALSIDPNNAPALQNMGILALRQGDAAAAQMHLTRAIELNPRLPLALNTLGVVYARGNDLEQAVASWERAVAIDARQYDALYNIGLVSARAGRTEQARRALSRFVATAPASQYASDIATARQVLATLR